MSLSDSAGVRHDGNIDDKGETKSGKIADHTSIRRLSQLPTLSEPATAARPTKNQAVKSTQDCKNLSQ